MRWRSRQTVKHNNFLTNFLAKSEANINTEAANGPFNSVVYREMDNVCEEVAHCAHPNDSPEPFDEPGCQPMEILNG